MSLKEERVNNQKGRKKSQAIVREVKKIGSGVGQEGMGTGRSNTANAVRRSVKMRIEN